MSVFCNEIACLHSKIVRFSIITLCFSFLNALVIFGEDVAFGGVFRCTVGLKDKYGMVDLRMSNCFVRYGVKLN